MVVRDISKMESAGQGVYTRYENLVKKDMDYIYGLTAKINSNNIMHQQTIDIQKKLHDQYKKEADFRRKEYELAKKIKDINEKLAKSMYNAAKKIFPDHKNSESFHRNNIDTVGEIDTDSFHKVGISNFKRGFVPPDPMNDGLRYRRTPGSPGTEKRPFERLLVTMDAMYGTTKSFMKVFVGILEGVGAFKILKSVPSALSGVLKLLEFGFLYTLKPLADFLARILMPVALGMIKFAIWLNGQDETVKTIVAILEGILLTIAGIITSKAVGKAIDATLDLGAEILKWLGKLLVDDPDFATKVGKTFLKWLENSLTAKNVDLLKPVEDAIGKGLPEEEKLTEPIFKWIARGLTKDFNIALKVAEYIDKELFGGKVFDFIGYVLEKLGLKGGAATVDTITGAFGKLLGETLPKIAKDIFTFFSKALDISIVAGIIAWLTGWLASLVPPDNPIHHFLQSVADGADVISTALDPIKWLIDMGEDIKNFCYGDHSFSNTLDELNNLFVKFCNTFIEQMNGYITLYDMVADKSAGILPHINTINEMAESTAKKSTEVSASETTAATNQAAVAVDTSSFSSLYHGMVPQITTISDNFLAAKKATDDMVKHISGVNNTADGKPDVGYSPTNNNGEAKYFTGDVTPSSGTSTNASASLKHLAEGGIVTSPLTALVGESGPEAVIPLDMLQQMMNSQMMNTQMMAMSMGKASNQNVNVTFSGIVEESKFRSIIKDECNKIFNSHLRVSGVIR